MGFSVHLFSLLLTLVGKEQEEENGRGISLRDVWEVSLVKECFSLG